MSMVPQETELGYAPPMVRHFSIFLDNRVGKLRELLGDLSEESGVSVRAISIMDSSDYAVIRLIFDKPEIASRFLDRHGYPACQTNVLVAELGKDHELHHLCKFLLGAELNIRFAYPTMPRPDGHPTVVLSTDERAFACSVRLISSSDSPLSKGLSCLALSNSTQPPRSRSNQRKAPLARPFSYAPAGCRRSFRSVTEATRSLATRKPAAATATKPMD